MSKITVQILVCLFVKKFQAILQWPVTITSGPNKPVIDIVSSFPTLWGYNVGASSQVTEPDHPIQLSFMTNRSNWVPESTSVDVVNSYTTARNSPPLACWPEIVKHKIDQFTHWNHRS